VEGARNAVLVLDADDALVHPISLVAAAAKLGLAPLVYIRHARVKQSDFNGSDVKHDEVSLDA